MTHSPHDSLVKATFSHPAHAADLFRTALPPALVAQLDFGTLARCPGSFVDAKLQERLTDLLYSVELAGRAAFIYLLLEHQSTVDRLLVFRLWRYMSLIWQDYLEEHPGARHLPVIVPMVLHHSATGWTGPRTLRELFDIDPALTELWQALEELLPRLTFVLDDLSVVADSDLRARTMAALPRLVLWALKNARGAHDVVQAWRDWVEVLREAVRAPNGVAALSLVVRYIIEVNEGDPIAIRDFLDAEVGPEAREAYMTGAEILTQRAREEALKEGLERGRQEGRREGEQKGRREGRREGEQEGRREGRREGEQEGRRQALQSILSEQLAQRFGELPHAITERLEAAGVEELERWVKRILLATTLDDIFRDH